MKDAGAVEDSGVLKRINGDLERIWNVLVEDLGLEVKDHTGKDFDYGMALKVVTTQPTAGITKERVIERANGERGIYGVVDKDPACIIIPLERTAEGEFLTLVEQYRFTVGARFMELPHMTRWSPS